MWTHARSANGAAERGPATTRSGCARVFRLLLILAALLAGSVPARATPEQRLDLTLRGKTLTISIYRAAGGQPRGTVIMGSGDVGWVGLAVDMSEFLSDRGYTVVGINVRQYLGSFTAGKKTLTTAEPPGDYDAVVKMLSARKLIVPPVILSGVSEGAALAVLAGSFAPNHAWVHGVLTMGLPPTAELGWRWSDFTTWITKKDSDEPMFRPKEFVPSVAPLPLCMIQSTKDEYVAEADYRMFESVARDPKKLVLIDASNHRFTDRRKELQREILGCLAWMEAQKYQK
jgi:alpha/beta superfamily hydrolase